MIRPKVNEIYRHFKGNMYQIVCIAEDSESGKEQVIYRALYAPYKIYSRELSMFMSPVDRVKYPDADQDNRFELMIFDDMTLVDEAEVYDYEYKDNTSNSFEAKHVAEDRKIQPKKPDGSFENKKIMSSASGLNLVDKDDNIESEKKADKFRAKETAGESYAVADKSGISPVLLRFLETEGVRAQIECLTEIRESLTPEVMTSIEFSVGMEEAGKGDIYDRYRNVKNYLQLKLKYERQHR